MNSIRQFVFLLITFSAGFTLAFYLLDDDEQQTTVAEEDTGYFANPFAALEPQSDHGQLNQLQQRISQLEQRLTLLEARPQDDSTDADDRRALFVSPQQQARRMTGSTINRRLFNVDNLVRGGVSPGIAEDIVRRKNQVELDKLELQDRAQREGYLDTQQFYDELAEIESRDVDLRAELGDDLYDRFLFDSKQHNRVRITQVIIGSEAEKAGIINNDIVLSYDDNRVFTWQELKDATSAGSLGEYVNMVIDRNGEIFSLAVPRGPLGVQLGYARSDPSN
jgi:hypothetical protein